MISTKKTYKLRSASDLCDIHVEAYFPDKSVKTRGIIQIAHGMAEHCQRYEDFASFLAENGFAVFINDHLGHGKSVNSDNELGFFGKKSGYIFLIEDMKKVQELAEKECPNLPVILFGHSMGSFLARLYTERYGHELAGAIFCGTSGANPAAPAGLAIIKTLIALKGDYFRSRFIDKMAFGSYNKRIKPSRTSFDWLTTRNDIVDKYISDPYCGFLFTTCGYRDLMSLVVLINRPEWYTNVPISLPIYLIAGAEDPVGNYGKGVKEVYHGLIDSKHTDVSMKLFPGDRHEILNEKDSADVYNNILSWIDTVVD